MQTDRLIDKQIDGLVDVQTARRMNRDIKKTKRKLKKRKQKKEKHKREQETYILGKINRK